MAEQIDVHVILDIAYKTIGELTVSNQVLQRMTAERDKQITELKIRLAALEPNAKPDENVPQEESRRATQ